MISVYETVILQEWIIDNAIRFAAKLPGIRQGISAVKSTTPFQKMAAGIDSVKGAVQSTNLYQNSEKFLGNHPYAKEFVHSGLSPGNIADSAALMYVSDKFGGNSEENNKQEYDPNQPFAGALGMARDYSKFTDENPVLGYGLPVLGIGTALGAGYLGKRMIAKKGNL